MFCCNILKTQFIIYIIFILFYYFITPDDYRCIFIFVVELMCVLFIKINILFSLPFDMLISMAARGFTYIRGIFHIQ